MTHQATRFAVDVARFQVVKELPARFPKDARVIAVLWRFRDRLIQHHVFQCMRQYVDAILFRGGGENEIMIKIYTAAAATAASHNRAMRNG
jgi:hypothetical protein